MINWRFSAGCDKPEEVLYRTWTGVITKPPIIVQQSSSVFLSRIGKLSDRLNRLLVVVDDSTTQLRAEEVSTTFNDDDYCV